MFNSYLHCCLIHTQCPETGAWTLAGDAVGLRHRTRVVWEFVESHGKRAEMRPEKKYGSSKYAPEYKVETLYQGAANVLENRVCSR